MIVWLENLKYWLFGGQCPFCGKWQSGYWHRPCPTINNLPANEAVHAIAAKVRHILQDEPADRFVHTAHEACDRLEQAFPLEAAKSTEPRNN